MKCTFDLISFGNKTKTNQIAEGKVVEMFNDFNVLIKRIEYDKFDRTIDVKNFDSTGVLSDNLHFEYFETENEKGFVETFKSRFQEYVRKSYIRIEEGLKHHIDDYTSNTKPENSYINDFVYDLKGKLITVISHKKL